MNTSAKKFFSTHWQTFFSIAIVLFAMITAKSENLYHTNLILLLIAILALIVKESIKNSQIRNEYTENINGLVYSEIITSIKSYFSKQASSLTNPESTNIDVCYFTQTPPTRLYNNKIIQNYWEETAKNIEHCDRYRRLIFISNNEMFEWLKHHLENYKTVKNYTVGVLYDKNYIENTILTLCLSSNKDCYMFSPHAQSEQPAYIYLKGEKIYNTLLVAYERMWKNATIVLSNNTIEEIKLNQISSNLNS